MFFYIYFIIYSCKLVSLIFELNKIIILFSNGLCHLNNNKNDQWNKFIVNIGKIIVVHNYNFFPEISWQNIRYNLQVIILYNLNLRILCL